FLFATLSPASTRSIVSRSFKSFIAHQMGSAPRSRQRRLARNCREQSFAEGPPRSAGPSSLRSWCGIGEQVDLAGAVMILVAARAAAHLLGDLVAGGVEGGAGIGGALDRLQDLARRRVYHNLA